MKKILFTIQWYPSVYSANGFCDQNVIDQLLLDDDYEITCLAYRPFGSPKEEIINNVKVHRFIRGLWWNIRMHAKEKDSGFNRMILKLDRVFLRLKQLVTIPFYPVTDIIPRYKFSREANRLYKKHKFDMVISEHNGEDSLHAGSYLKRKHPDIKFVAVLWDPFTGKEPAKYLPRKLSVRRIEKAEKREIRNADAIIAMQSSRGFHEEFSLKKDYYNRFVFLDIPRVVPPIKVDGKSSFIKDGWINIVYAGVLTLPDRNPEYIIDALNRTSFASNINLIFFCNGNGIDALLSIAKSFDGMVSVNGYVEKAELLATYQEATMFLNIGGPNPSMVPSKIFEYLSYGKPILSTYTIDDDSSKSYLDRYNLALCVDQRGNVDDTVSMIERFFESSLNDRVSFEQIEREYWDNTPKSYKVIIDKMFI